MLSAYKQCSSVGHRPGRSALGLARRWCFLGVAAAHGSPVFATHESIEILYEPAGNGLFQQEALAWWGLILTVIAAVAFSVCLYRNLGRQNVRLRNELEQAESRLVEAQLIAKIGSWSRNFDTGETFWSVEACKVLGLQGNESEYKHYERLIHPDDLDYVTEVIAKAYHQGGAYQCDHRVICPGNMEKYIRLAGQVYLGNARTPVRETGTIQDITQQHLAETAIKRSEKRLRSILDATPYPILILENTEFYPVLFANSSTYALFELDETTTVEGIRLQNFWVLPNQLQEFTDAIIRAGTEAGRQVMMKNSLGETFWVELAGSSLDYSGVDSIFVTLTDITERQRVYAEMERMATTDPLTGALNRHSFVKAMQQELSRALQSQRSLSLLIMNIDHFKMANEHYGFAFGDEVIKHFCEIVRSCLREEDLFGRLDSETFAVVLLSSEREGGYLLAERIRKQWQGEDFEFRGNRCSFTVSVGVSRLLSDRDSVEAVLERADKGLHAAKRAGRNCVIVHSGERAAGLQTG